jgi:murein L,D-transpeptidase YafK
LRIGRRGFATGRAFAVAAALVFTAVSIEHLRAADGFAATADRVVVIKGDRQLMLLHGEHVLRRFPIALGWNPVGHKLRRGDGRTPEGRYVLDGFNPDSDYYRSIHISYPNGVDRLRAARRGDQPGGDIMIHGVPPDFEWIGEYHGYADWTAGCIAVTNEAMDVIWNSVEQGVPIDIRP